MTPEPVGFVNTTAYAAVGATLGADLALMFYQWAVERFNGVYTLAWLWPHDASDSRQ